MSYALSAVPGKYKHSFYFYFLIIVFFKCATAYWFIVKITNDDIANVFDFIKLCIEGMFIAVSNF